MTKTLVALAILAIPLFAGSAQAHELTHDEANARIAVTFYLHEHVCGGKPAKPVKDTLQAAVGALDDEALGAATRAAFDRVETVGRKDWCAAVGRLLKEMGPALAQRD